MTKDRSLINDFVKSQFLMGKSTIKSLINDWLVVWNMAFLTFHILGIIVPTDELIFFRGVGIPPTSIGNL